MKLAGWKSDSVFRRYFIIEERDVVEALRKASEHSESNDQRAIPRSATRPTTHEGELA